MARRSLKLLKNLPSLLPQLELKMLSKRLHPLTKVLPTKSPPLAKGMPVLASPLPAWVINGEMLGHWPLLLRQPLKEIWP